MLAILLVSCAVVAVGLLPAAVGLAILLGRTVPLEFAAAAGLTILAGAKLAAVTWGFAANLRASRAPEMVARID